MGRSRRARGVPARAAAKPKMIGRYGALLPLFRLVGVLASPPCGEWKAYRVTAAIARNSIQLRAGLFGRAHACLLAVSPFGER
jgi:hypothetical protein